MPKRTAIEKLERYKEKIRRLERKCSAKQDDVQLQEISEPNVVLLSEPGESEHNAFQSPDEAGVVSTDESPFEQSQALDQDGSNEPNTLLGDNLEVAPDPQLLAALGASCSDVPDYGPKINDSLAALWPSILKKCLHKEDKENLTKRYLTPENCRLIQAPKLNPEISAAVCETSRYRDKKIHNFQQQLGAGLSAVNKALDIMITPMDDKVQPIKHLSDGCRILCDLHYSLTKDRTKLILPSLDKNFLHVLSESDRDDTLFGSGLSEKIKASKTIERQSHQIKKTANRAASLPPPATRPSIQGNWTGLPRYPANRGGRGGQTRPAARAQQPPPRRSYQPPRNPLAQIRFRAPQHH